MHLEQGRSRGEVRLGCVVGGRDKDRGVCDVFHVSAVFSSLLACHKMSPHLAYQLYRCLVINDTLHPEDLTYMN